MTLSGETSRGGDAGERLICVIDQRAGAFDATLLDEGVWSSTSLSTS